MYKHPIAFLSVNNLTVARYAAAMMVDYVGFCFDSNSEQFITVAKAKEIMGWLSGVKFIGEFNQKPTDEIMAIALELQLDAVLIQGNYTSEEIASIPFQKIGPSSIAGVDYLLEPNQILNQDGSIFALTFTTGGEDETGVMDFETLSEKLQELELQ